MSKPYLNHSDVELREDIAEEGFDPAEAKWIYRHTWVATADGRAKPTKERIIMERSSTSAGEALLLLKEALEEQGYELR